MKKLLVLMLLAPALLFGQSAREIIRQVDRNENFTTQRFFAAMVIQKGSRRLVKTFNGYGYRDGEKSFITFTNPEDRGVKYLKIENELWIYFPDADDIMKISGHMLRRGMMGSDISYEDMLESSEFEKKYDYVRKDDATVDGMACFVIDCTAKVPDSTYARQVLYVQKNNYVPVKAEMYAKGGRLLKKMTMEDIRMVAGRAVPMTMTIRDMRKKDSLTVVSFSKILFDVPMPAGVFTRQNLRR